nr:hypothetical protein [Acinetobacter baumannii]
MLLVLWKLLVIVGCSKYCKLNTKQMDLVK